MSGIHRLSLFEVCLNLIINAAPRATNAKRVSWYINLLI